MLVFDAGDEAAQKTPHRLGAVPADHVRRDLVADEIGENRGMPAAGAHAADHRVPDLRLDRRAVEKGDVLRPGQPDQDLQARLVRSVQQPERRHGENPDRVDPGFAHQCEIFVDDRLLGEGRAMAAGRETGRR